MCLGIGMKLRSEKMREREAAENAHRHTQISSAFLHLWSAVLIHISGKLFEMRFTLRLRH